MHKFLSINFDTPGARAFDWLLSFISIAVGLYFQWHLWTVMGVIGCLASWYRPLTKVQSLVRGILVRKTRG